MSLQVFPYAKLQDDIWSISDSVMAAIWMQLEQEGKIEQLFYDGSIKDVSGWLQHIKSPGTFGLVVADVDLGIPVHIAWLKDVADGIAWAHHSAIGKYRRGAWEKVRDYWQGTKIRILLGLTPENNKLAVKFLSKICKFTIVGTIPEICNAYYEGCRVGGVVSYFQLNQQEVEQWAEKAAAAASVITLRI